MAPSLPVDVEAVWRQIKSVPSPEPDPPLPHERPWAPPRAAWLMTPQAIRLRTRATPLLVTAAIASVRISHDATGAAIATVMLVLACIAWPWQLPRTPFRARTLAADARGRWEHALKRWRQEGSTALFQRRFNRLKALRTQLRNLGKEHARLRAALPERSRRRQLDEFLAQFTIADADIPEIGAGRKDDLSARGIVTAARVDHHRVRNVPGFGPQAVTAMLLWRQSKEFGFEFDPDRPSDPRDVREIEEEFQDWLKAASDEFAGGPGMLNFTAQAIAEDRPRLLSDLRQAWHDYQLPLLSRGPD